MGKSYLDLNENVNFASLDEYDEIELIENTPFSSKWEYLSGLIHFYSKSKKQVTIFRISRYLTMIFIVLQFIFLDSRGKEMLEPIRFICFANYTNSIIAIILTMSMSWILAYFDNNYHDLKEKVSILKPIVRKNKIDHLIQKSSSDLNKQLAGFLTMYR